MVDLLSTYLVCACFSTAGRWSTATSLPGSRKQVEVGLNAGPDCLLLVVLLLEAIVCQSSLDGILRKHWGGTGNQGWIYINMSGAVWKKIMRRICRRLTGAVKFNRRKTELFGNVSVLYCQSFIHLKRKAKTDLVNERKKNTRNGKQESCLLCYHSQICPSPTRWPESWRRWQSRSRRFWTWRPQSSPCHPPQSIEMRIHSDHFNISQVICVYPKT